MAEIAVIGCGQAGLVVATSFASLGHQVVGIDIDRRKIEACSRGISPIREPGLAALLQFGRYRTTENRPLSLRPKTSGNGPSSAVAGETKKSPSVVARA